MTADVQPVVAAILVEADPEKIDHLTERQRDHDEIDARGAQRDKADDERGDRSGADRDSEMDKAVGDAVKAEDADRIGADAEIGGVAEADEAAVPQDQIEAERGDRKDHHAGEQPDIKRRVGRRRNAPAPAPARRARRSRQFVCRQINSVGVSPTLPAGPPSLCAPIAHRRLPRGGLGGLAEHHRPLGGKRPCGRTNSTAAIRI